ncbi:efflux RND transporter periplasmic adaptor subunit [Candidatus Babeliales bacterium]|jgi:HlyD family secretion protein|nr:efflux RND transporter periplasmic adaptor subunit [Candidatus Babeliales bacterium]
MKYQKLLTYISILAIIAGSSWFVYQRYVKKPAPQLYKTEKPQHRNISQIIAASGILEIKDMVKIGSIVSGTIKELYVKEDQQVKKGELLAEIDPGTGDTDFQDAYLHVVRTEAELEYQEKNYLRKKELFQAGQLAKDTFEMLERDYQTKKADLKSAKTKLEKERLSLKNRKILAAGDGFVTAVNVYKGSGVTGTSFSSAPLFEIAPDITEMEAKLDIDESDIGSIKPGQMVTMAVTTYPDLEIKTAIKTVGFSPKSNKDGGSSGNLFYKATIDINNHDRLFRPGMTLNAKIKASKTKNALCLKGICFQTNPKVLKSIAKKLKYEFKPLEKKERKEFKKTHANKRVKFIWTVANKTFTEKGILLGITDDNYFEVKEGLHENDQVITDIAEKDDMEKLYKSWYKGSL